MRPTRCNTCNTPAPASTPPTWVLTLAAGASLLSVVGATPASAQTSSPDEQIAAALQAAPEPQRAGATVLGFDEHGAITTLREGSNELVCLSDNPNQEGWSVACYHESLEPYMARGRELRAQGVDDANERLQRRWAEAEAGTLDLPDEPATLYVMTGDDFDAATGTVENAYTRWVVYTPWATLESTGLPAQPPEPGAPWLMFPGTAGAHIMIMPPRPGG